MPPLGPRGVVAPPAPTPPKPTGNPFAFKPGAPLAPIHQAQRQAAQSERQAANRLPSRPALPIVPALKSYTPKQAQYIRQHVGPAVAHAVVNEGHAQDYINEAAQHERRGGSAADASTPFARLLRNSNAQERQTLHAFQRVGGADAINGTVEKARRSQIAMQLAEAIGGHASKQVADDLHRRGYFTPASTVGPGFLHFLPEDATATPKAHALLGFQPDRPYRGPDQGVASTLLGTAAPLPPQGSFINRALTDIAGTTTGALPSFIQSWRNIGSAAGSELGLGGSAKPLTQEAGQIAHAFTHPDFHNHPITSVLQYAPIPAIAGKGVGAAMRSGAFGDAVAAGAATERAPLLGYERQGINGAPAPPPVQVTRSYSGNVFAKAAQRLSEEARRKAGQDPNVATGARLRAMVYGGSETAHALAQRGLMPDVLSGAVRPGLVDREAASQEAQRRLLASQHVASMPSDRPALSQAVPLITEGVVRRPATLIPDLQAEIDRLEHAQVHHGLTGRELALNQDQIRQARDVLHLAQSGTDFGPAFQAAANYNSAHGDLAGELARLGGVHEDALRAMYQPIAIAHGGAVTAEQAATRYADAIAAEKTATADLKVATQRGDHAAVQDAADRLTVAQDIARRWSPNPRMFDELRAARTTMHQAAGAHLKALGRDTEQAAAELRKGATAAYNDVKTHHDAGIVQGLRKPDGSAFTTRELHDLAMRETEGRGVGFLSQRPPQSFRGAVRSRLVQGRAGTTYKTRTGNAFSTGTYDRSYAALQRQMYETANRVSSHRAANALANRFGFGRFEDEAQASRAAQNFNFSPTGERIPGLEPVPWHIGPEPTTHLTDTGGVAPTDTHTSFEETPQGKFTLMPRMVAERLGEHDLLTKQGRSIMNAYTSAWRNAQLFTSPRWIIGNPQENMIRVLAEGANPAGMAGRGSSFRIGRTMVDRWKTIQATPDEQLRQMGLLEPNAPPGAGEMVRQVARAHVAAYDAGSHFGSIAVNAIRQGDKLPSEMPVGEAQAVRFWRGWRDKLGKWQSGTERNAKIAVLGRIERRQLGGFMGQVGKLNDEQVRIAQAAADHKLDPNVAAAHADRVMRAMGNWSTLTPKVRKAVQRYTPFGLWWLNSMKFLGRLPFDHPFITAATVAAVRGTEGHRPDPTQEFLAGGLHVKLPVIGGATLDPTYYSPAGVFIDPMKTAADMWMPQMSNLVTTAFGVQPFPDKQGNLPALKAPGGRTGKGQPMTLAQRIMALANVPLQGITPGARQLQTVLEKGGSPFGTANLVTDALARAGLGPSQIKPGTGRTAAQVAAKLLSPTRITLDRGSTGTGKPGRLPPGVSQAEINHYVQQAQRQAQQAQGQVAPGVSQGELNYYLRQAQAATR